MPRPSANRGCGACHGEQGTPPDLVSAGFADELVDTSSSSLACADRLLIDPNDPGASYLIEKLGPNPTCGVRMPYNGSPLSDDEIACIEAWVEQVAGGGP